MLPQFVLVIAKMTIIWPKTEFWARSNFNSFANFGPLITNDDVLES